MSVYMQNLEEMKKWDDHKKHTVYRNQLMKKENLNTDKVKRY